MKNFSLSACSLLLVVGFSSQPIFAQDTTETTVTTETEGEPMIKRGGLFLEPFLAYEMADTRIQTSTLPIITDDTSGTNQGFGVGGRIGGHVWEAVFLAADVRYSRTTLDDSFYRSAEMDNFNYGATVGVQTPWAGIRLWGTYVIGGFADPKEGVSGLNLKFDDLTGYRIGAGLHLAAVSVNLEYHDQQYGKTNIQNVGALALRGDTNIDTDTTGYTLSVGFPLEL